MLEEQIHQELAKLTEQHFEVQQLVVDFAALERFETAEFAAALAAEYWIAEYWVVALEAVVDWAEVSVVEPQTALPEKAVVVKQSGFVEQQELVDTAAVELAGCGPH